MDLPTREKMQAKSASEVDKQEWIQGVINKNPKGGKFRVPHRLQSLFDCVEIVVTRDGQWMPKGGRRAKIS
jgi:hypothetical protein